LCAPSPAVAAAVEVSSSAVVEWPGGVCGVVAKSVEMCGNIISISNAISDEQILPGCSVAELAGSAVPGTEHVLLLTARKADHQILVQLVVEPGMGTLEEEDKVVAAKHGRSIFNFISVVHATCTMLIGCFIIYLVEHNVDLIQKL
jgi:hypothetical protein